MPERLIAGLLTPMRHLAAGWDAMGEGRRTRLLALEATFPGGTTAADLAWFACDGTRDVFEIARLLRREGQDVRAEEIEEWFGLLAELGVAAWRS